MVPMLVVLTVVGFLIVDGYLVYRLRRIRAEFSRVGPLFDVGHTWLRVHRSGLVTVGASEFASNFAGPLTDVELPAKGDRLRRGERGWTLVGPGNRRLDQAVPVSGRVIAVNPGLHDDPSRLRRSPEGAGWILRLRPRGLSRSLKGRLHGTAARKWLDSAYADVAGRLTPALGHLAQDGGEWTPDFGQQLDDERWQHLRRELFPEVVER